MTTIEKDELDRPRCDPLLEFHPASDGEPFAVTVFHPVNEQYVGLGKAPYRLLSLCDGTRTAPELCVELGVPRGASQVANALVMLREKGLLLGNGSSESAVRPTDGYRVRRRLGPFELMVRTWGNPQLSLLEPEAFFARLRPRLVSLVAPVPATFGLLALAAGIVFVGSNRRVLVPTIPHGLFSREMLIAGLLTWAFIFIHELCHAAVLARFGGRVRRIGVMLFYGRPAMYVDANDAYVLPSRWQRVAVAAAGPVSHLFAAIGLAVVLTASQLVAESASMWERITFELIVANLVMLVLNLVPFVKLDGYWMLASALRRPHLRAEALSHASRVIGRRLPGSVSPQRFLTAALLTVFGVLSAICGSVLVATVLVTLRRWLLHQGRFGAALCLAGAAAGVILLARRVRPILRALHASGDLGRVFSRVGLIALATLIGLALVGLSPIAGLMSFFVRTPWESLWR